MTRLVVLYSLVLALSVIPGGLAGPVCAHKHYRTADCVEKCKSKWGWLGNMMGTDRWGSVMSEIGKSTEAWEALIAQACGSSATSLPAATDSPSSVAVAPTPITQSSPAIGTTSDPAESTGLAPTSFSLSSSGVAISSSVSSSVLSSAVSSSSAQPTTSSVTKNSQPTVAPTTTRFTTSIRPTTVPTITTKTKITQAPPPATTSPVDNGSSSGSGSSSSGDVQAYLTAHNTIRANHGAAALVWSDELASKAQQWANGCKFQHSGGSLGSFGENLAAGTGSSYGISQAVKSWTDEVSEYDGNNPQPSHFTQVVWKGTQQLGCAVQECDGIFPAQYGKARYYVCEYFPAGNVIGRFAENVQV